MQEKPLARRLRRLPDRFVLGRRVKLASDHRARLLGLARLDLEEVGGGLLIPNCSSVHTYGMRFPIDIHFLDRHGEALALHPAVPGRRVVRHRKAAAVLEIPADTRTNAEILRNGGEGPGRRRP